jgi:hypothetical protein
MGITPEKARKAAEIHAGRVTLGENPLTDRELERQRACRRTSERVLGHALTGVRGVYGRHAYLHEKHAALTQLAAVITGIINPPTGNIVRIAARR